MAEIAQKNVQKLFIALSHHHHHHLVKCHCQFVILDPDLLVTVGPYLVVVVGVGLNFHGFPRLVFKIN